MITLRSFFSTAWPSAAVLTLALGPTLVCAEPVPTPTAAEIVAAIQPTAESVPATSVPAPSPPAVLKTDPVSSSVGAPPGAPVTMTWQNNPLPVPLLIGQERRIDFPEPISELDIPKDVEGQSQIVLAPTGTLHWTAKAPFAPVRVLATSLSGTLYQLQVEAGRDGAAPGPLVIVDPVLEATRAHPVDDRRRLEQAAQALLPPFLKKDATTGAPDAPNYAALARFALAHFTGPTRFIPRLTASRVAVSPLAARRWVRVQSDALQTRPLAQWKIEPWYVTAVSVVNTSPFPVPFEPRALRGDLRFVATLHPALGPQGSGHNGTIWAIVTDQPFNQAVLRDELALTSRR